MTDYELPLLELFNRLREAGLPLGIDEYYLVLRALQSGFGIPDRAALARLCCTLWIKSSEDKLLFDYHFERVMAAEASSVTTSNSLTSVIPDANKPPTDGVSTKWFRMSPRIRYLVLGGIFILLTTGIATWLVRYFIKECPNFTSRPIEVALFDKDYKYNITTCRANQANTIKITALEKPSWLEFKDNGNGIAILQGKLPPDTSSRVPFPSLVIRDFSGKELAVLPTKGDIKDFSFSPDGQHLAIASDKTASLWNLAGEKLAEFKHQGQVTSISFSPDGQRLATTSGDGTARLWNLKGNQLAVLWHKGRVFSVIFSPDGQRLATTSGDGTARLWNLKGNQLAVLWHKGQVNSVSFSSNGQFIATASNDGTARLWNLKGNQLAVLWHKGQVGSVSFSPNGQFIATDSDDMNSRLWNLSGKLLTKFKSQGSVSSISFTPDGQNLINTSDKRTVSMWDISGKQIREFKHQDEVTSFSLSSDGKRLATSSAGKVRMWDISGKQLKEFSYPDHVHEVRISPDGQRLATFSYNFVDRNFTIVLQVTEAGYAPRTQKFTITPTSSGISSKSIFYLIVGGIIVFIVLPGGYVTARWLIDRNTERTDSNKRYQSEQTPETSTSPFSPELTRKLEDEVQVARAVQQETRRETETFHNSFTETNEYFPVTRRQMKQSWRYLRRLVREGTPTELDVEATVNHIASQGLLLKPVLMPRRVNRTELLLLIDQDGSMVPFHTLSHRLAETALQGGRIGKSSIYYFHNCPSQYLYRDPNHQEAKPIKDILSWVHSQHAGVLIFSDAGAARGGLNPERIELTAAFLNYLKQQVRYIAWLNPMPRARWLGTTAGEIARLVPMFEFNRRGLEEAIGVLRGKLLNHDV